MRLRPSSVVPKISRRRVLELSAVAFAGTVIDGLAGSEAIRFEHHRLALPNWDANGFRAVQVSDVHLNNSGLRDRAMEAFRMAIDVKPDLIVFTGDFLNEATPACLQFVTEVFNLLGDAGCPCVANPGNHEYTCGNTPRLYETVGKTPIRLLVNEAVEVSGVTVFGLDDGVFGQPDYRMPAVENASRSRLVLLHEPDLVRKLQGTPSLVLSGHSHGGEVCLPTGFPLHLPTDAKIYYAGYYPKAPFPLYVSRGVGTLGPCRIFCPPEVTLFTLTGA